MIAGAHITPSAAFVVWGRLGECSDTRIWIVSTHDVREHADAMAEHCRAWVMEATRVAGDWFDDDHEAADEYLGPELVGRCPDPVLKAQLEEDNFWSAYRRETTYHVDTAPVELR